MKYKDWVYKKLSYHIYDSGTYSSITYTACYGEKFKYRFDPVPDTGRYKGGYRGDYRLPKTTYERKWAFACDSSRYIRGRRRSNQLVNSWSDLVIADNKIRSWKRTKKQYQWD